jgi:GntR family transcriptional regulator
MAETPAYQRIAALLRAQIESGALAPGDRLPSISRLTTDHGVSSTPARRALAELVSSGLVEGRFGSGYFVRARPAVRRLANTRYRLDAEHQPGDQPGTSFTADRELAWEDYTLDRTYTVMSAADDVFRARGRPEQTSTNYLPWSLVGGTPVADPEREPWPGGTPAQAASLGHPITLVEEDVTSRMPSPEEAELLSVPPGTPVFAVTRRMLAGELVVELAHIVLPADRVVLAYRTDL